MKTRQDTEFYEHKYTGTLSLKNGKTYLNYNDGAESCALVCDGDVIRLIRLKSGSRMVFEKDVKHQSFYSTPIGDIPVTVLTDAITDTLLTNGTLSISYKLYVEDERFLKNKINIIIEEI